jgi:hypothetical protein
MKSSRPIPTALCMLLLGMLLLGVLPAAHAFVVPISNGSRQLYFRVGDPGTAINTVSVTVPVTAVGNGISQQMRSDAVQTTSEYDGYEFCNLPYEVYVGGYYRHPSNGNGGGNALLSVSAPASLINSTGQTIPFSEISWASTGNRDTGPEPIPAGSFNGGLNVSFPANTWQESCHSFSYANSGFVAAGTYTGRVVYTLSSP